MYFSGKLNVTQIFRTSLKLALKRNICNQNLIIDRFSVEHLKQRGLIHVHGQEVASFLQGLVTNDVRHLEDAKNMYTMFLNIRGRVMCDSIIYKDGVDSFLIECDKDVLPTLQKHLTMYRVRKKINIDLIEDLKIWVVFSKDLLDETKNVPGSSSVLGNTIENNSEAVDLLSRIFHQSKIISRDPRLADLGYRLIVPSDQDLIHSVKYPQSSQTYRQLRYKLGVGEGVSEFPLGKCFPLELNCDYLHGVSFHKGCYIGQELTARVYHTGVIRKRLMPIMLNSTPSQTFTSDAPIETAHEKKVIGKLCGLDSVYGLALIKVSEALSASGLNVLNASCVTWKPKWWAQEAPKERLPSDKEVDVKIT